MTTATAATINQDKALREQLVKLLTDSEAHANFETAVKDMPAGLQGKRPQGAAHSPWEMLEHLRIAQWDILEFARNAKHKSPDFPEGYWPKSPEPPDAKAWEKSAGAFRADRKALCDLVTNESTDLFVGIPHGDGQTILRQALLAADHNAYHIGELILLRRILGAWD
jgi:DinB superfamily